MRGIVRVVVVGVVFFVIGMECGIRIGKSKGFANGTITSYDVFTDSRDGQKYRTINLCIK